MVSLQWIAGIIVVVIGIALLAWALYDAVLGAGVTIGFIIKIIVGIILVIVGAWLSKGGIASLSA